MAETDGKPRPAPADEHSFAAPGVILVTPAKTVSFATPRALELLACEHAGTSARLEPVLAVLSPTGPGPRRFPFDVSLPAGRRRLRADTYPLPAPGGWLLLVEDMEKVESHHAVLSDSVRAQMWKRLRPVLHHDFKAPIQSILWSLEILERAPPGKEDARRETIDLIRKETASLQARLQGLLDEIAPYETESAIVDTAELVHHAAHLIRSECGLYGIDVDVPAPGTGLLVDGHRDDLKQALLTLLFVALDFLREGGTLTLVAARAGGTIELAIEGKSTGSSRGPARAEIVALPAYEVAARIAREHGGSLAMVDRSTVCFVMTLPALQEENAGA